MLCKFYVNLLHKICYMNSLYLKYMFSFLFFLHLVVSPNVFATDNNIKPAVYSAEPINQDEMMTVKSSDAFKSFIQVITEEDITHGKVFYFSVHAKNGNAFDRMVLGLFKDELVMKLHPNQEKIAILVNPQFDINTLIKDAELSEIKLIPITKEVFFGKEETIQN